MKFKKTLQAARWIEIDGSNNAVGVIFPKPSRREIAEINQHLSGLGVAGESVFNNDWAWVNIKNLSGFKEKIGEVKTTLLSDAMQDATWSQRDLQGNRSAYFKHRKACIACVEALKQMHFIPYQQLGFASMASLLLPIEKGHHHDNKPNLFCVKIPDIKLQHWFKDTRWEAFGSKKIPGLDAIAALFAKAEWAPDTLADARAAALQARDVHYTAKFKHSVEVARIGGALALLTSVSPIIDDKNHTLTFTKKQVLALGEIVPEPARPRDAQLRLF